MAKRPTKSSTRWLPNATDQAPIGQYRWCVASTDTMEPTIRRGDDMLVDTSVTTFVDDGVYVVAGASIVIARVRRLHNGGAALHFDNPKYPPRIMHPVDHSGMSPGILGRVRGAGRAF
jgi:phage repressor protein C with HTH and peptisase S24 domain